MSDLVVRRLLVDLHTPPARHWNGGDAFRSAFFSALSMSFPVGEQYFMDSVRAGLKTLPPAERERFAPEVQGFVGQEATHRRIHGLFNGHLERLGYQNQIERRAIQRLIDNAHQVLLKHQAKIPQAHTLAAELQALRAQFGIQSVKAAMGEQRRQSGGLVLRTGGPKPAEPPI